MNILVVCQYYFPEEVRINEITRELVKRGNKVTVLTGLPNYPEGKVPKEYKFFRKRKETIEGVDVIRCFEIGRRKGTLYRILNYVSFALSSSLKAAFMKDKFDKVLVYQLSPITMVWSARIYKRKYNKKVVIYSLDLWPESLKAGGIKETSAIYKCVGNISQKMYMSADKILVTSKSFIDILNSRVGGKVKIEYLPQHSEKIECCTNSGEKHKNEFNFVFAGNVGKAQSVETIIRAAEFLKYKENIKFHIVGDGSSLESCKELVNKLGLSSVAFYGRKPRSEMSKYYSLADAMLVTLIDEEFCNRTLPAKIQSYMGAKKAIIASANGEIRKAIEDAKCGICVAAEDGEAMAKAILQYISLDEFKQKEYQENAFKWYNENYTLEKYMNKLIENLEE